MTTTLTPTLLTTADARAHMAATLTAHLTAKGFTVTPTFNGTALHVYSPEVGNVATLSLHAVRANSAGVIVGEVGLDPRLHAARRSRSRYPIASSTINLTGLTARLKSELPKIRDMVAASRAAKVRETSDAAVLASLGLVPSSARVEVFDGLVDIRLTNLRPALAELVLKLVRGA